MKIVLIIFTLIFVIVLMSIEIPKMLSNGFHKELWLFFIILITRALLHVLKILNVNIPNPSDAIAWLFSPFIE